MRSPLLALTLPLALLVPVVPAAHAVPVPTEASADRAATARAEQARIPRLQVASASVTGLDNPWDVKRLPGGTAAGHRAGPGAALDVRQRHAEHRATFPSSRIWVSGETGLMSLEVDPDFADNRRFYTCSGWQKAGGGHDVRVNAWRLDDAGTARDPRRDPGRRASRPRTGRHGGCRLLIAAQRRAARRHRRRRPGHQPARPARRSAARRCGSTGSTGRPWPGNPFIRADNRRKRYVFTYGHRNVQGLAQRRDGTLWSVEHGSYRDDEVNRLRPGGDYGWNPVPGYNESVPMTDQSLPGRQVGARWRSGDPTLATSGAAWVYGKKWGRLSGTLAVAALKAQPGGLHEVRPRAAGCSGPGRRDRCGSSAGSARSTLTPDDALLVTTDNDGGDDAVLRVTPQRRR